MQNSYALYSLLAFAASCTCGMATIPVVLDFCKEHGLYDMPNARKVHKNKIPRLGGVVFVPSMLIGVLLVLGLHQLSGERFMSFSMWTLYFVVGLSVIYFTGLVDDVTGVRARTKLFIQFAATAMLPMAGLYVNNLQGFLGIYEVPFWAGAVLTVLFIAFICNATSSTVLTVSARACR